MQARQIQDVERNWLLKITEMQHSQKRSITNLPCYNREHENASMQGRATSSCLFTIIASINFSEKNQFTDLNRGTREVIAVLWRINLVTISYLDDLDSVNDVNNQPWTQALV